MAKDVGAKIKKLMGEGKSQEQSTAIALAMQRAGKLDKTSVMNRKKEKSAKRMALVKKGAWMAVLLFPALAFAQASMPSIKVAPAVVVPDDPAGALAFIKGAYESKAWTLLVAAVLMIVVRLATTFKFLQDKLNPAASKWIAVGLAMASSLATNLMTGSGWVLALVNGATAGLMAIGAWEAIGKNLPGLKKSSES